MLSDLEPRFIENNTIPQDLYKTFDVKRGLRNADGSGVLSGLTRISSVIGSKKIDGKLEPVEGALKYRDIPLADVIKKCQEKKGPLFETVTYLLLVGEMPSDQDLKLFCDALYKERELPEDIIEHCILGIKSKNIMNKIQTCISALYANDSNPDSIDPFENFFKAISIIAKIPTIVAYSYLSAYKHVETFTVPDAGMSISQGFLSMLNQGEKPSEMDSEMLDLMLLLHAEHGGGNNSTFTTYVVTSSQADIYSALAAAVGSLKGPLHGSANKKVVDMMEYVKRKVETWDNPEDVRNCLQRLLAKEAYDRSGKIYGLGHAVYTKSDPRAEVLKEKAIEMATQKNRIDELNLYFSIEKEGPSLFSSFKGSDKVISPNVDFFSGFVYDCLDIPREIFTPLFAMARSAGWCSHRIEELLSGKRIIRPGYKYVGD
ncbi:citrate synthase [bacterium]|jgi:citrate synthase|nr:citrate synthase [bacterium]